jgi:hypothetical protein
VLEQTQIANVTPQNGFREKPFEYDPDYDFPSSESQVSNGKSWRDPGFILPKPFERDGVLNLNPPVAPRAQAEQATFLWLYGLKPKAIRQAHCLLFGGRRDCASGDPSHCGYVPFLCGNRYCPICGPKIFTALFAKHLRLAPIVHGLVPHWPVHGHRPSRVIAKIDFTSRNRGVMPTPEEVRKFNQNIRKFFRALERKFGISRKEYGFLWCDEFGGQNSNLHAHGVYAGPWLPQKEKELSLLWAETVSDGSFIVSIKRAKSFEAALAHALKYPRKFLSHSDPERLAQLEKAFHGVRRVHALGAFYNPKDESDMEMVEGLPGPGHCPFCGDVLLRPTGWKWTPIPELRSQGLRDWDEIRQEVGRKKVFEGIGPP